MADPSPAKKARLSLGGVDTVVVLDYGSQYTQLITRRVRELGVYAVLLPGDVDMVRPRARGGASSAGRRSPLALVLLAVFFHVSPPDARGSVLRRGSLGGRRRRRPPTRAIDRSIDRSDRTLFQIFFMFPSSRRDRVAAAAAHHPPSLPPRAPQKRITDLNPKVIILSGGPNSVHVEGAPTVPDTFFDHCESHSIPVLGICYGMQLIVQKLGGEVKSADKAEYGRMPVHTVNASSLYGNEGDSTSQMVWMSHGDEATKARSVITPVPIRPRRRGARRSLRTFGSRARVFLSAQGPSLSIPTRLDAFPLRF
jgi:GMP synthase-like glutamine amidotransferase